MQCLSAGSGMLSMSFAVVLRDSVLLPSAAAADTAAGAAALPFAMPFVSTGASPARADGSGSVTSSKPRYSRSCTTKASRVGSTQKMVDPAHHAQRTTSRQSLCHRASAGPCRRSSLAGCAQRSANMIRDCRMSGKHAGPSGYKVG